MKADAKPESLRQSMSWLHTWSGLLLGWLLYAVFFTGTLSYFVDEINVWMHPETHASVPGPQAAEKALAAMAVLAPQASNWNLNLPGERSITVGASWREPGAAAGRAGITRAELDAASGERIDTRQTRAGNFLYRFHFELYGVPRIWGRWIVGIATMFMFVAIISGVVTHKKIFSDFFTFRPRKGQRSWLDAHNASAVLALPFHIMITFSGLLLFMAMLLPWGVQALYGDDTQRYNSERRGVMTAGQGGGAASQANARGQGEGRRSANASAALTPIAPLMAQAQARWPERGVGAISIANPGTTRATIELVQQGGHSLVRRGASERMVFDGVDGRLLRVVDNAGQPKAWPGAVYNVLSSAHLGRFAGPALRWLLFLSGVVGTLMVATGMVLWVVKRLPDRKKLGHTPAGHRLVEILNVGTIAGLSIATAGYFWLNRLIPAQAIERADLEIKGFFIVWLLCLLHGALRAPRSAWRQQLWLAAALFALLPLLNPLTGGAALPQALAQGQWSIAGFDLAMLALALVHAAAAWQLRAKGSVRNTAAAPMPAALRDMKGTQA